VQKRDGYGFQEVDGVDGQFDLLTKRERLEKRKSPFSHYADVKEGEGEIDDTPRKTKYMPLGGMGNYGRKRRGIIPR